MRTSDWSSDVCSSDLIKGAREMLASAIDAMMRKEPLGAQPSALKLACSSVAQSLSRIAMLAVGPAGTQQFLRDDDTVSSAGLWEIGRASCRERVCPVGEYPGVAGYFKKKKKKQ